MPSISQINAMNQEEFVAVLGAIFEDTPAIAYQTWHQRPFRDVQELHQQMMQVVYSLDKSNQLALICAHPDLGSRVKMAEASIQEQAKVGLDRLSAQEYAQFQTLNQAYKQTFNFPFILAVRHHSKESILTEFKRRLKNSIGTEMQQALTEIAAIAELRLCNLIHS